MKRSFPRIIIAGLPTVALIAACSTATQATVRTDVGGNTGGTGGQALLSPAARAKADSGHPPYTAADVYFLSGMIAHHAQAVLMAGWAPSHGASASVAGLCERIVVAQRDEIAFMQRWLRERHQPVPVADATGCAVAAVDAVARRCTGSV